jgi:hypothetical protein
MQERIQEIQNAYFAEYQAWTVNNVDAMRDELERWEAADATILSMPLAEQATYADYVMRKFCAEQPLDLVVYAAGDAYATVTTATAGTLNSAAIGGLALLLQTVMTRDDDEGLKDRLFREHQLLMANQKVAANNQSVCTIQ